MMTLILTTTQNDYRLIINLSFSVSITIELWNVRTEENFYINQFIRLNPFLFSPFSIFTSLFLLKTLDNIHSAYFFLQEIDEK
jgi:hypothetical protein